MWQLRDQLARWEHQDLSATVDLGHPDAGLEVAFARHGSNRVSFQRVRLVGLEARGPQANEPLQDAWTRGDDLFAAYLPRQPQANQLEVYWRVLSDMPVTAVEWIVSVHTGLLDDVPTTWVKTSLPTTQVQWMSLGDGTIRDLAMRSIGNANAGLVDAVVRGTPGAVLAGLPSGGTYLEAIHPSDYSVVEVASANEGCVVRSRLFPDHLEKGVIRRARLRGWFLPPAESTDLPAGLAWSLLKQFVDSRPPLTT